MNNVSTLKNLSEVASNTPERSEKASVEAEVLNESLNQKSTRICTKSPQSDKFFSPGSFRDKIKQGKALGYIGTIEDGSPLRLDTQNNVTKKAGSIEAERSPLNKKTFKTPNRSKPLKSVWETQKQNLVEKTVVNDNEVVKDQKSIYLRKIRDHIKRNKAQNSPKIERSQQLPPKAEVGHNEERLFKLSSSTSSHSQRNILNQNPSSFGQTLNRLTKSRDDDKFNPKITIMSKKFNPKTLKISMSQFKKKLDPSKIVLKPKVTNAYENLKRMSKENNLMKKNAIAKKMKRRKASKVFKTARRTSMSKRVSREGSFAKENSRSKRCQRSNSPKGKRRKTQNSLKKYNFFRQKRGVSMSLFDRSVIKRCRRDPEGTRLSDENVRSLSKRLQSRTKSAVSQRFNRRGNGSNQVRRRRKRSQPNSNQTSSLQVDTQKQRGDRILGNYKNSGLMNSRHMESKEASGSRTDRHDKTKNLQFKTYLRKMYEFGTPRKISNSGSKSWLESRQIDHLTGNTNSKTSRGPLGGSGKPGSRKIKKKMKKSSNQLLGSYKPKKRKLSKNMITSGRSRPKRTNSKHIPKQKVYASSKKQNIADIPPKGVKIYLMAGIQSSRLKSELRKNRGYGYLQKDVNLKKLFQRKNRSPNSRLYRRNQGLEKSRMEKSRKKKLSRKRSGGLGLNPAAFSNSDFNSDLQ